MNRFATMPRSQCTRDFFGTSKFAVVEYPLDIVLETLPEAATLTFAKIQAEASAVTVSEKASETVVEVSAVQEPVRVVFALLVTASLYPIINVSVVRRGVE